MPPVRKVDLLPEELKAWLHDELKARGFGEYVELAEALNDRLEGAGLELRIGKSALHSYGQEYAEFARLQEEASQWAKEWMTEGGMETEAERHRVLFQMMTSIAFKVLKAQMEQDGAEIDARELHFLGKMMKDIMSSAGIREKLMSDERARIAREAREAAAQDAAQAAATAATEQGLSEDLVQAIRSKILGVAA